MGWREVILSINSLGVGNLQAIRQKLEAAGREVNERGQTDLAARLREAAEALGRGDMPEYRRLLAYVVSKLGHLRD